VKRLFVVLCLWIMTLPALAQDVVLLPLQEGQTDHAARVWSFVQTVELVEQDDGFALEIFGTLPDGCERPTLITQERQGAVVFVDVFHDPMPQTLVACPKMLLPIEAVIPLDAEFAPDEQGQRPGYVVVNNHYFQIMWTESKAAAPAQANPVAQLIPAVRTGLYSDTMLTEARDDGFVYAFFAGWLPEGCPDPVVSRVVPKTDTPNEYHIDIFRILENPLMCPLTYVAVPFEIAVKTPLTVDQTGAFHIAGQIMYYPPLPSAEDDGTPVLHVIDTVETVVSQTTPVEVDLLVTAHQPDSCLYPVQVTQTQGEFDIKVEIFRVLPPNVRCGLLEPVPYSSTIRLNIGVRPGTYTIDVNGTVITVKI
jgi:hypothetical protein